MMLLSFSLAQESYGVDILTVQEIRVWEGATRLPGTAAYLRGVINLRGEIVPVMDLRERLGLPLASGGRPVVIVFRALDKTVGGIVDAVLDVHTLTEPELQPAPPVTEFVSGLATIQEEMLIVLDIPRLIEASTGEVGSAR